MDFQRYEPYQGLILRVCLGLTLIFWGYEKLTFPKLVNSYIKDYQQFMIFDVEQFLVVAGIAQIIIGSVMILGIYTRIWAASLAAMAIITIIIPGFIILKDVPYFAYAFATTGGALILLIQGAGKYSWDAKQLKRKKFHERMSSGDI